jgi:hypothetical protein
VRVGRRATAAVRSYHTWELQILARPDRPSKHCEAKPLIIEKLGKFLGLYYLNHKLFISFLKKLIHALLGYDCSNNSHITFIPPPHRRIAKERYLAALLQILALKCGSCDIWRSARF